MKGILVLEQVLIIWILLWVLEIIFLPTHAAEEIPQSQDIISNKNRLTSIPANMFQGLNSLYTLDLLQQGNRLESVVEDDFANSNLGSMRHLDISNNKLTTLPQGTFQNTFLQTPDARVLYCYHKPWMCDESLNWFRTWLRQNLDVEINKPNCQSMCDQPGCFPPNCPLSTTVRPPTQAPIDEQVRRATIGWIILGLVGAGMRKNW